jgi:hypothetical protein
MAAKRSMVQELILCSVFFFSFLDRITERGPREILIQVKQFVIRKLQRLESFEDFEKVVSIRNGVRGRIRFVFFLIWSTVNPKIRPENYVFSANFSR